MIFIYQHRRNDTHEVFYVGIGAKNRPFSKDGRSNHWHYVVNKAGYVVEILREVDSWEEACAEEIELIAQYGRLDLGQGLLINKTNGGDGTFGMMHSDKAKKKMSEKRRGRKLSEHQKQRISEGLAGKPKSENHKQKLSEVKLGKPLPSLTEDHKQKISKAKLGKKREDVSIRNQNRPNPIIGKMFITNGTQNKMIQPTDLIPSGWHKGVTKNKDKS